MLMVDGNGAPLRDGASVKLLRTPPDLLQGLPQEDQAALRWAGKEEPMRFVGADGYGNVELEFRDPGGTRHWILVRPTDVAVL